MSGTEEKEEKEETIKYEITMRQWRQSIQRVLPEKFKFIPHFTYLKFLRVVWLVVFKGYGVREALEDVSMSTATFYKEKYQDFNHWLREQGMEVREQLAKGKELKSALPKSSRQKLTDLVWSVVLDRSEEFERLKENNKAKDRRIEELKQNLWKEKGRKEAKGERTEEEKEIREAYKRAEEGGSFVKSAEWDKYLGDESEEE